MKNIKIIIEYDGSNYCGWQKQINGPSIQEEIEKSLYKITNENIIINGSGRTDAKVHAYGQVASFKTNSSIPPEDFYKVINQKLPEDIRCISSTLASDEFHARYNSIGKHYRYIILNRKVRPTFDRNYVEYIRKELDVTLMEKAIKKFEGIHDFEGFMSTGSKIKDTTREIYKADIIKKEDKIIIDISGNGFLYNMVRIIVGLLIEVGLGKIKVKDVEAIIASKQRKKAGKTAKACGLYLVEVFYN